MILNWRAISRVPVALVVTVLLLAACSQPPAPVIMGGSNTGNAPPRPLVKPASGITGETDNATAPLPRIKPRLSRKGIKEGTPDVGVAQVEAGDTVYALSRLYHVGVRDIISANGLKPPYKLLIGQMIRLPTAQYHVVHAGETIYGLSEHYGVDMSAMVRVNNIPPPYRLVVGQRLRLPGTTAKVAQDIPRAAKQTVAAAPKKQLRKGIPGKLPPLAGKYFLWPAEGRLISSFGPKEGGLHNDGINFAVPRGAPLRAAENGIVAYAGNELPGYGNLLLIRHDGGWMSAYAHNDTLLVSRGDEVKRGQIVSHAGSTGSVASPQAHFELRRNGKPVNPEKYLAKS